MTAIRMHNIRSITALVGDTAVDVTRNSVVTIRSTVTAVGQLLVVTGVGRQVTRICGAEQSVVTVLGFLATAINWLMRTLVGDKVT